MSILGVGAAVGGIASLAQSFLSSIRPSAKESETEDAAKGQPAAVPTTEEKFLDYARMSVAERMREQLLKSKGLSEDDLNSMDPEKRAALEKEISEELRDKILKQTGKETGGIANILV